NIFITDIFQHLECLRKLKRKAKEEVTIVIHDPSEISKVNEPYLKYWNIITIRKSMQQFIRVDMRQNLNSFTIHSIHIQFNKMIVTKKKIRRRLYLYQG
ncbi:MAG: hypothetical protein M3251_05910, partial [Thermoproteota archaeon]|nr:hypothetical protein [Thermoproteota archaeon]